MSPPQLAPEPAREALSLVRVGSTMGGETGGGRPDPRDTVRTSLWTLGLLTCLQASGGERDVVQLKDGKELHGRVVYEDTRFLILRKGSRDTQIDVNEIQHVESLSRNLDALLDNTTRTQPWSVSDNELLAAQAQESGLEGEAALFWWRVLAIEPGNEAAHRALGHKKRGSGWGIPLDSRTVAQDKRVELARDWGSAWEFHTLHYHLRTNLALEIALDLALDLERYYQGVFDLFAGELQLFDVCKPMNVCVYADRASYPETAAEAGHYDAADDTVHVDASQGFIWEVLAHEGAHQLLYDTAVRERSNSGAIPAWLDEGLAEYIAGCVGGYPWKLKLEPGRALPRHFQTHARAPKPFTLGRVLNLSSGDFFASSDRDLKYAQAYTLVHFCLHASDGRYRDGFLEFLRGIYHGQGSSTDFKHCLHAEERELEEAWLTYVKTKGR